GFYRSPIPMAPPCCEVFLDFSAYDLCPLGSGKCEPSLIGWAMLTLSYPLIPLRSSRPLLTLWGFSSL
ncbi:hypothetical protein U1Q18_002049, partial [Sarracenia purpurea var. burkii]